MRPGAPGLPGSPGDPDAVQAAIDRARAEAVYTEPARSYRSAIGVALIIVAGFLIDLAFGGAIAHLIGWIAAFVIVVGLNLFVVHAARSVRSLQLTPTELRVGEEAIARTEILGAVPYFAADLPVLGWTTGLPRGLKSLTLSLDRGVDLVVPTRHPDRLRAALQVPDLAARAAPSQAPRAAEPDELALLGEVDRRSDALFRTAGYVLPDRDFDEDGLRAASAVYVVGTPPVGFVWVDVVDGAAHVQELAVLPGSMRQGFGGALLEQAATWAGDQGLPALTLTTFADVPWNAPFYARRGFVEIDELSPGLRDRREREQDVGLDDVGRRVAMRREL